MQFDEKFLQSVLIRPPRVLGRSLRPFCAGHAVLLDALSSPFVSDDGDWSPEALGIAVLVCSLSFEKGKRLLVPGGRGDGLCLRARWLLWRLGRVARKRRTNLLNEYTAFAEYLEDYQSVPAMFEGSGRSPSAPWPFSVVMGVVVGLKGAVSVSQAWNMPLCECVFYSATVGDLFGDESLMSKRDVDELERVRSGEWRKKKPEGLNGGRAEGSPAPESGEREVACG